MEQGWAYSQKKKLTELSQLQSGNKKMFLRGSPKASDMSFDSIDPKKHLERLIDVRKSLEPKPLPAKDTGMLIGQGSSL